jgi:hypothetical protein
MHAQKERENKYLEIRELIFKYMGKIGFYASVNEISELKYIVDLVIFIFALL